MNIFFLLLLLLNNTLLQSGESPDSSMLDALLSLTATEAITRGLPIPTGCQSVGSVSFKAWNGTTPVFGGQILGSYADGTNPPNTSAPAHIIVSTTSATSSPTPTPALMVTNTGNIGIGNFPCSTDSAQLPNAQLNVEGRTGANLGGAFHVGRHNTALENPFITGTPQSGQVDGNFEIEGDCKVIGTITTGGCIPITQASIPLTISQPGYYYFTQNITYGGASNAITITGSNVSLDLGGYSLTCTSGSSRTNNGIQVTSGRNIAIGNGVINNFLLGINSTTTPSYITIDSIACNNCTITIISSNTTIQNATIFINDASYISSGYGLGVTGDIFTKDIMCKNIQTNLGIHVICKNFIIDNCSVENYIFSVLSLSNNDGLFSAYGDNGIISNCKILNNNPDSSTDGPLPGFFTGGFTTANVVMQNCIADNNQNIQCAFAGAYALIISCIASNNTCVADSLGLFGGFVVAMAYLYNCSAINNTGYGFISPSGSPLTFSQFINCLAKKNTNAGFSETSFQNNTNFFLGCSSIANSIGYTTSSSFIKPSQYLQCKAYRNTTNYQFFPTGSTQTANLSTLTSLTCPWTNPALT